MVGVPFQRANFTAVWTGAQMIVWGGVRAGPTYMNSGALYTP
jgi:hypothetical protein